MGDEAKGKVMVIGVGKPLRGDDGVGAAVAQKLKEKKNNSIYIIDNDGEALDLMDVWVGAERVILIDACVTGGEPGTVRRFDASTDPLPAILERSSTHGFGVGEAVELARALGRLPGSCVIYAVEGAAFERGEGLSPRVAAAVDDVAARILAEAEGK